MVGVPVRGAHCLSLTILQCFCSIGFVCALHGGGGGKGIRCCYGSPPTCAPAISEIVSATFRTMPPRVTKPIKYNKNHNIFEQKYTSELKVVRDKSSYCRRRCGVQGHLRGDFGISAKYHLPDCLPRGFPSSEKQVSRHG